jgi:hypothetical protein
MLGSPSFSASDLMASGVDLTFVFPLIGTLCRDLSLGLTTKAKGCKGHEPRGV